MKEIKCDNCGEVLIKLVKGSMVKPNIYALHEQCPDDGKPIEPFTDDTVMDFLGIKK